MEGETGIKEVKPDATRILSSIGRVNTIKILHNTTSGKHQKDD